ncbi:MAG TPA: hypothetical protein VHL80_09245 [Polyangia bacterium]|nr:hypothetical protein [Polyangia bacterium]
MRKKPPLGKRSARAPLARAYVDAVEAGRARLVADDDVFTIPARLLPAGAREGSWIELAVGIVPAPPSAAAAIRRKLAKDDPGGPIKL